MSMSSAQVYLNWVFVERVEINFHRAFALREHPAVPHARPAALLAATAGVKL